MVLRRVIALLHPIFYNPGEAGFLFRDLTFVLLLPGGAFTIDSNKRLIQTVIFGDKIVAGF
jgi:hypothetical protein